MRLFTILLTVVSLVLPCFAETYIVDQNGLQDFDTIQAAIDDANDGDEIEVAPGTYREGINFNGKAIRLFSRSGPEVTKIDGIWNYIVVKCISGEDANTILEGFNIVAGSSADNGAGMYNDNSSPTVINCTFSQNYAEKGSGMYNWYSSPTVTNCTFSDNIAYGSGGGMYNIMSSPKITSCTFTGNSAIWGGGIYNTHSNAAIANCIFSGNQANIWGGGMLNYYCNPTVTNCSFSNNTAKFWGGGMHNDIDSSPKVINCIFFNNTAENGGGMSNYYCDPTVTDCTFSGNIADSNGGGIFNVDYSNPTVTECILWNDEPDEIYNELSSTPNVNYSDVKGGWAGEGNIDVDPLFTNADANDFHLQSQGGRWDANSQSWVTDANTSPCIDAGDWATPIGFEPFPNGGRVNMGAFGGTAEASKSYFGTEPCETIIAGDINGDCIVNFKDLSIMALHWLE